MNSLPLELFEQIINQIPIYDRIKLRLVCKKWSILIKNLKFKCLLVCSRFEGTCTQRWFDTNQKIKFYQNILESRHFNFLLSKSSIDILCNNVKELAIYNLDHRNGCQNFELILNKFTSVIKLDLYDIKDLDLNTNLNLPNLNVICIDNIKSNLLIRSTNLKNIKYCQFEFELFDIKLIDPLTVEYVEVDRYFNFLDEFKNLKILFIFEISDFDLSKFKKLEQIQFFKPSSEFNSIKLQKQQLKNHKLEINYLGMNIENLDDYTEFIDYNGYDILDEKQIKFYLGHFTKLSFHLPFILILNFNEFENLSINLEFFNKLTNLFEINTNRKVNYEFKLIEFMKYFKYHFSSLQLYDCKLSSNFFTNLSDFGWFLQTLTLGDNFCDSNDQDLNFLNNLKNLNTLRINQNLSSTFIKILFENLSNLKDLFFLNNQFNCSINYLDNETKYQLTLNSGKFQFNQINDIFEF